MTGTPQPNAQSGERHDLIGPFSNPWVGLLGTVFTLLGVGLAIFFYLTGARTRRLTYCVNPVKTIVVKGGETSSLRVLYGDRDIKGDVTGAQVALWNDGTESIRPENILSPVRILLHPSVPILEAKVRKSSRGVIGAAIDASSLADGIVPISWKILEHNDGAVVQLIFAGPPETDIAVEGTVEGQRAVLRLESSQKVESPSELMATEHRVIKAESVLIGIVFGMLLLVLWLKRRDRGLKGSYVGMMGWFALGVLCAWFLVAWRLLRVTGPPFGF